MENCFPLMFTTPSTITSLNQYEETKVIIKAKIIYYGSLFIYFIFWTFVEWCIFTANYLRHHCQLLNLFNGYLLSTISFM